ncbi:MAG: phosphopantothenoylcysteine decarboxylase [Candidatus Paceibacterota bacterium]|jgi:phosphopantothenate-cysteine ligase/phosphopantothenoylcysteine decarboxylase/phosphopantothenate--cysteine ligase
MKILVTAGATLTPIDKVRGLQASDMDELLAGLGDSSISNIFRGQTGLDIAKHFYVAGHDVVLLTSDTRFVAIPPLRDSINAGFLRLVGYRTFDELDAKMGELICAGRFDAVVHSAAVSDFMVSGVFSMDRNGRLVGVDKTSKISSGHERLFLELGQTHKIVDRIRTDWKFDGVLVKFKLQSGISDERLIEIASESRTNSGADTIVANCLEWFLDRAYVINDWGTHEVLREMLAPMLLRELGDIHKQKVAARQQSGDSPNGC